MESQAEISSGLQKGLEHGRYSTYTNHGCRCGDCRLAGRIYYIENRRRILARQKERYRNLNPPTVKWPEPPNICMNCTAPIPADRRFCSTRCGGSVQRGKERLCVQCGLPWKPKHSSSKLGHCPECRPQRQPWEPPAQMSSGMRRNRRRQLIERDGERCACCGATEDLEIHHRKPRSEGGGHELENLEFLCGDCHSAAHGFVLALPLAA